MRSLGWVVSVLYALYIRNRIKKQSFELFFGIPFVVSPFTFPFNSYKKNSKFCCDVWLDREFRGIYIFEKRQPFVTRTFPRGYTGLILSFPSLRCIIFFPTLSCTQQPTSNIRCKLAEHKLGKEERSTHNFQRRYAGSLRKPHNSNQEEQVI